MTVMAIRAPVKALIGVSWSTKEIKTPGITWTLERTPMHLMQNK